MCDPTAKPVRCNQCGAVCHPEDINCDCETEDEEDRWDLCEPGPPPKNKETDKASLTRDEGRVLMVLN